MHHKFFFSFSILSAITGKVYEHQPAYTTKYMTDTSVITKPEGPIVPKRFTLIDRINSYTSRDVRVLRIVPIVSASVSIAFGIMGIYSFFAIDKRNRVFRHQLIVFLLLFDLLKAIILLIYPARILLSAERDYYDKKFCQVVGFFTATAIEGADVAILSFAVHLALLIFRPGDKVKHGKNLEGGLFRYRYFVYAISALLPLTLASLAYIHDAGYVGVTNWCALPPSPVTYRLVLNWAPRYAIIIAIFLIYGSIYWHVSKQYRQMRRSFGALHGERTKKKWYRKIFTAFRLFGWLVFPDIQLGSEETSRKYGDMVDVPNSETTIGNNMGNTQSGIGKSNELDHAREDVNRETFRNFEMRRVQIVRQMKSIFIYPISYVILWLAPLAVQATQYNYRYDSGIFWLNAISSFMQPFNATVDTLVFLLREKPWNLTTDSLDTSPFEDYEYSLSRTLISFLPLFHLPDSREQRMRRYLMEEAEKGPNAHNSHDFSNILAGNELDFVQPKLDDLAGPRRQSEVSWNSSISGGRHSPREKTKFIANAFKKPLDKSSEKQAKDDEQSVDSDGMHLMDFLKKGPD